MDINQVSETDFAAVVGIVLQAYATQYHATLKTLELDTLIKLTKGEIKLSDLFITEEIDEEALEQLLEWATFGNGDTATHRYSSDSVSSLEGTLTFRFRPAWKKDVQSKSLIDSFVYCKEKTGEVVLKRIPDEQSLTLRIAQYGVPLSPRTEGESVPVKHQLIIAALLAHYGEKELNSWAKRDGSSKIIDITQVLYDKNTEELEIRIHVSLSAGDYGGDIKRVRVPLEKYLNFYRELQEHTEIFLPDAQWGGYPIEYSRDEERSEEETRAIQQLVSLRNELIDSADVFPKDSSFSYIFNAAKRMRDDYGAILQKQDSPEARKIGEALKALIGKKAELLAFLDSAKARDLDTKKREKIPQILKNFNGIYKDLRDDIRIGVIDVEHYSQRIDKLEKQCSEFDFKVLLDCSDSATPSAALSRLKSALQNLKTQDYQFKDQTELFESFKFAEVEAQRDFNTLITAGKLKKMHEQCPKSESIETLRQQLEKIETNIAEAAKRNDRNKISRLTTQRTLLVYWLIQRFREKYFRALGAYYHATGSSEEIRNFIKRENSYYKSIAYAAKTDTSLYDTREEEIHADERKENCIWLKVLCNSDQFIPAAIQQLNQLPLQTYQDVQRAFGNFAAYSTYLSGYLQNRYYNDAAQKFVSKIINILLDEVSSLDDSGRNLVIKLGKVTATQQQLINVFADEKTMSKEGVDFSHLLDCSEVDCSEAAAGIIEAKFTDQKHVQQMSANLIAFESWLNQEEANPAKKASKARIAEVYWARKEQLVLHAIQDELKDLFGLEAIREKALAVSTKRWVQQAMAQPEIRGAMIALFEEQILKPYCLGENKPISNSIALLKNPLLFCGEKLPSKELRHEIGTRIHDHLAAEARLTLPDTDLLAQFDGLVLESDDNIRRKDSFYNNLRRLRGEFFNSQIRRLSDTNNLDQGTRYLAEIQSRKVTLQIGDATESYEFVSQDLFYDHIINASLDFEAYQKKSEHHRQSIRCLLAEPVLTPLMERLEKLLEQEDAASWAPNAIVFLQVVGITDTTRTLYTKAKNIIKQPSFPRRDCYAELRKLEFEADAAATISAAMQKISACADEGAMVAFLDEAEKPDSAWKQICRWADQSIKDELAKALNLQINRLESLSFTTLSLLRQCVLRLQPAELYADIEESINNKLEKMPTILDQYQEAGDNDTVNEYLLAAAEIVFGNGTADQQARFIKICEPYAVNLLKNFKAEVEFDENANYERLSVYAELIRRAGNLDQQMKFEQVCMKHAAALNPAILRLVTTIYGGWEELNRSFLDKYRNKCQSMEQVTQEGQVTQTETSTCSDAAPTSPMVSSDEVGASIETEGSGSPAEEAAQDGERLACFFMAVCQLLNKGSSTETTATNPKPTRQVCHATFFSAETENPAARSEAAQTYILELYNALAEHASHFKTERRYLERYTSSLTVAA